jgi:hypothetical protein
MSYQIVRLLQERFGENKINKLLTRIENAGGKTKLHHRKLKDLLDGKDVPLRASEAWAIYRYLLESGVSPSIELFDPTEGLLDSIADGTRVSFFLPVKYDAVLGTDMISRWDMRGTTRLARTKQIGNMGLAIWDVPRAGPLPADADIEGKDGAVITVGSPTVNQMTVRALKAMTPELTPKDFKTLPFFFVYEKRTRRVEFMFRADEVTAATTMYRKLEEGRRAIVLNNSAYVASSEATGKSFALLVAQRQPHRPTHLRVVLCGLSGPSTYALAKAVQANRIAQIPPNETRILAAVIEVEIVEDAPRAPARESETRTLGNEIKVLEQVFLERERSGRWIASSATG